MTSTPTRPPAARADDELDSALPAVPGVPWWAAVLICVVFTAAGVLIGDNRYTAGVPTVLWIFFIAGCVLAALAVRGRAIFTAMVQPPLVLAACIIVVGKFFEGVTTIDSGVNVALSFPLMVVGTVAAIVIGATRLLLDRRR